MDRDLADKIQNAAVPAVWIQTETRNVKVLSSMMVDLKSWIPEIEVAYVGECMTTGTDFSSQTAQAVASGAEFLYYPCFLDTVPLFVGAARNASFTGIIMGGDGWDGSDTTGLEDKFEGCYFTNHYTGEDVTEIQCHGGQFVIDMLLEHVLSLDGIRMAEPGEFTKRAFLNGKLDLTEAEAVADLIDASSREAARSAANSLSGAFSGIVDALTERLTKLRAYVEASLDFPDEDIDFMKEGEVLQKIRKLEEDVKEAFEEARTSRTSLRRSMQIFSACRKQKCRKDSSI